MRFTAFTGSSFVAKERRFFITNAAREKFDANVMVVAT